MATNRTGAEAETVAAATWAGALISAAALGGARPRGVPMAEAVAVAEAVARAVARNVAAHRRVAEADSLAHAAEAVALAEARRDLRAEAVAAGDAWRVSAADSLWAASAAYGRAARIASAAAIIWHESPTVARLRGRDARTQWRHAADHAVSASEAGAVWWHAEAEAAEAVAAATWATLARRLSGGDGATADSMAAALAVADWAASPASVTRDLYGRRARDYVRLRLGGRDVYAEAVAAWAEAESVAWAAVASAMAETGRGGAAGRIWRRASAAGGAVARGTWRAEAAEARAEAAAAREVGRAAIGALYAGAVASEAETAAEAVAEARAAETRGAESAGRMARARTVTAAVAEAATVTHADIRANAEMAEAAEARASAEAEAVAAEAVAAEAWAAYRAAEAAGRLNAAGRCEETDADLLGASAEAGAAAFAARRRANGGTGA